MISPSPSWTPSLPSSGLSEFIATSSEQYVEIAARMASDVTRLARLRCSLRELMSRSGGNWDRGGDEYNFQSNNGQNGNDAVGLIAVGGGNNVAIFG